MGRILSAGDIARYNDQGYHYPIRALSPERAERYRRLAYDLRVSGGGRSVSFDVRISFKLHLAYTWLDEMVHDPLVLDVVEDIIGPDILVWSSALFMKDAGDGSYAAWHQDTNYTNLKGLDQVSVWIALSPSTVESGCMRVVPESHKIGRLLHEETDDGKNILARQERLVEDLDDSEAVDLVLRPGEMSLHHLAMVHGSSPNNADYTRIGYAIRYIAPHVDPTGRHETAMLARGEDRYGYYELEPRPKADLGADAVAAFERAVAIRKANFYDKEAAAPTATLS